jgi:CRISPR-associated exonuclease Cas4
LISPSILFLSAFFFLFLALLFFWLSGRKRQKSGLPGGRVIYADTSTWGKVEKPLYDPVLGLTGKPDYLVERGDEIIPVEVKSRQVDQAPYDAHIYQLGAYCMLVEHVYGKRPRYGILHYTNRTFAIDYTPELEAAVRQVMTAMQAQRKEAARSHESPQRCNRCGFRSICDQALRI